MYLSTYRFAGDPTTLAAAYDCLQAIFTPDSFDLRACVLRPDGIVVVDACPTRADFESFSASRDFHAALDAVGLPRPRIEPLGDVHDLRVGAVVGRSGGVT
jgi:hypothetical protein